MPQREIEARELSGATVSHVALVKRGAIRSPFKVQKTDENQENLSMFNLGRVDLFKREALPAAVVAVIARKGADLDAVKARVTAAGFSVEKSEEAETGIFFRQGDGPLPKEALLVKLDGDVAVAVANVAKGFSSYNGQSTMFGEMMAQEGFFPGCSMAVGTLMDTVGNIMYKAADPSEAKTQVAKAFEDAKAYVTGLVEAIPVTAFKLDTFKAEGGKLGDSTKIKEPDGKDQGDGAAASKPATDGGANTKELPQTQSGENGPMDKEPADTVGALGLAKGIVAAIKAAGADEAVQTAVIAALLKGQKDTGAGEAAGETATDGGKNPPKKGTKPAIDGGDDPNGDGETGPKGGVKKAEAKAKPDTSDKDPMDGKNQDQSTKVSKEDEILAAISNLTTSVQSVAKAQGDLAGKVDGLATRVEKTEGALGATIVGGGTPGDKPAVTATKSDAEAGVGLIDTAYMDRSKL
jgi:hypothetical protein